MWIARRDKPERIVPTLESIGRWKLRSKRRDNGVLWRRTCWLLTEATPTEQKFAIGLPAHLSRTYLRVWKNPHSLQPTSTEPMKCRRYILSINAQQISSFERVYRIVHYRVVSHFSLYNSVYLSAWCAVKLQKKLGISSRCHNEKVISLQVNKLRFLVYRVLLG